MSWEPVIGLEVHVQLRTTSKIFCGCSTRFGDPPNANTCPVCLGHPGVLPVLNRAAVEMALKVALATGARVRDRSVFARKNYFYPDLPKGYQISQYELPLAEDGRVPLAGGREAGLVRIHLEEDAGKLVHDAVAGASSDGWALLDFNRAGIPLIEVVGRPDLSSPAEARELLEALHRLVTHIEVSDGNMEEGSLRCDANVSLRRPGDPLGTRTEVKNLNSFRNLERAVAYEIARHAELLDTGRSVEQETRGFDADRGITFSMRGKEEAHDYRYFPEPDLPPLLIDEEWIARIRAGLPELPADRCRRFQREYGLSGADATTLTDERALAGYFEEVAGASGNPRAAANWVLRDVLQARKGEERGSGFPLPAPRLAELIRLVDEGKLSASAGREVFADMVRTGRDAAAVVAERGLLQVSDSARIEELVDEAMAANPQAVESFRAGKEQSLGFLVGVVMKASGGTANPRMVNELLRKKLSGS